MLLTGCTKFTGSTFAADSSIFFLNLWPGPWEKVVIDNYVEFADILPSFLCRLQQNAIFF